MLREALSNSIKDALTEIGAGGIAFTVERPSDPRHGDFATNAALLAAKPLGLPPRQVAERLREALVDTIPAFPTIEVAGPGFLNFTLRRNLYTLVVVGANAEPENWGGNDSWEGKRVVVEYTDPNPFKEFHVGHLFTNAVGESIARLFMMNGAGVFRVNYQGDVGLHVAHAIYGMQQLGIDPERNFTAEELGRAYALGATAYKENPDAVPIIREINKHIYDRDDAAINSLYDAGRKVSLDYFETIYKLVGTEFADYFFESEGGPRGKALVLAHPDIFPESDGARVFKGEAHGLHTRVFLNKEGLPTYEAKELALAKLKEERLGTYDHSVISTSNEITEYFKVLLCAMSLIYPELAAKTEHVGHGTVRLATGKMSSRTGQVIPAIEFINEVAEAALAKMAEAGVTEPDPVLAQKIAIGAIKYATLHGSILQDKVFDKEKALSFEGDSGPYLQYTHARIVSVEEKARTLGITPSASTAPETPYSIERTLLHFPDVVADALTERAPHKVATYLTELASTFNTFYAQEKIADTTDTYAPYKLALASAVRTTLKNGLWALGIEAPDRM